MFRVFTEEAKKTLEGKEKEIKDLKDGLAPLG